MIVHAKSCPADVPVLCEGVEQMIVNRVNCACVLLFSCPLVVFAQDDTVKVDTGLDGNQTLTVALISPKCQFADAEANLRHFTELAERAAAGNARLICFPELALVSYSTDKAVLDAAEPIPGPTTRKLEAVARRLNVFVSVGMAEKDGDQHHIAQILVGPDGYLGKYRKYHPTGPEQSCGFLPGQSFQTWDIDGFRFGILICFDGRHTDTLDAMKQAHVDIVHHPHGNNVGGLGRDAEEWTRSKMVYFVPRAIQSRAYMLVNNSAEDTQQLKSVMKYSSGALVIDPLGQVVTRTMQRDRSEKMVLATLKKPQTLIPRGELQRLRNADAIFHERFNTKLSP